MTKQPEEIALMAESGRLLASVFQAIDQLSLVGMTTMQVNDFVEKMIVEDLQSRPASKGQYDFPYVLNASVNNVVCHGVPSTTDLLATGDIVSFDITLENNEYIADSSKTYVVGEVSYAAKRLVEVAYRALWKGIAAVHPGARLGDIGHGIERQMHEEPQVLHHGAPRTGLTLREGMVFTIEPMINQGGRAVRTEADGWTVVTRDKKLSAQFEHTVAVTKTGVRVLTLRADEQPLCPVQ